MTRDAPACPAATLRVRNLIHDTVLRDALECSRTSSSALTGDFAMWCASTRVLTSADAATARVEDHTDRRAGNGCTRGGEQHWLLGVNRAAAVVS